MFCWQYSQQSYVLGTSINLHVTTYSRFELQRQCQKTLLPPVVFKNSQHSNQTHHLWLLFFEVYTWFRYGYLIITHSNFQSTLVCIIRGLHAHWWQHYITNTTVMDTIQLKGRRSVLFLWSCTANTIIQPVSGSWQSSFHHVTISVLWLATTLQHACHHLVISKPNNSCYKLELSIWVKNEVQNWDMGNCVYVI